MAVNGDGQDYPEQTSAVKIFLQYRTQIPSLWVYLFLALFPLICEFPAQAFFPYLVKRAQGILAKLALLWKQHSLDRGLSS